MSDVVANKVACYLIRRSPTAELLLLLRTERSSFASSWQPVYGSIEPHESAIAAALRELHEETGVRPIRLWYVPEPVSYFAPAKDQVVLCPCFVAEAAADAVIQLCHEHTDFRWLPIASIEQHLLWPAQRRVVQFIRDELLAAGPAEAFLRLDSYLTRA